MGAAAGFKQGLGVDGAQQVLRDGLLCGRFGREEARQFDQCLILTVDFEDEFVALAHHANGLAVDGFLSCIGLTVHHDFDGLAWLERDFFSLLLRNCQIEGLSTCFAWALRHC